MRGGLKCMGFLAVVVVIGLVAAVSYMIGSGRERRGRARPVRRPGASGYGRASDAHMLFYAVGNPNGIINEQIPDGPRCDDPPDDGDAGEDQGDCDPGFDSSDSDGYDSGDSDSDDSDSGGGDSGGDSGGGDSSD